MRRNVGISGLQRQSESLASYSQLGESISNAQLTQLEGQLKTFQAALRNFATKHRSKIISDPVFRQHFSTMCAEMGVDPLGAGKKGVWDYLGVSDWTYGLAVQVVDVCLQTRERNGGLIEMRQLLQGVTRLRTGSDTAATDRSAITTNDIARAIKALESLGCGYQIITLEGSSEKLVRSVPQAFDTDSLVLLECAAHLGKGYVTEQDLVDYTRSTKAWVLQRAVSALNKALLEDGLVWVDEQATGGRQYWVPSLLAF